ncbi:MAG TPA: hypothetical protein VFR70_01775 [Flavobacterium sp.]|nr:hypothetical protein [Flavobacterium sp.]
MNNTKTAFFKSVLLLQFPMLSLLGILLYVNYERQEFLAIPAIHPHEVNVAIAVPAILFCASLLLSGAFLLLKRKKQEEDEAEIQKQLRIKNFWKFAFYCNIFFLIIILLFTLIANLQLTAIFLVEGSALIYFFIFFQALLVPLLSMIVASFMLSSGIYWSSNRGLASVILALGLFLLISWICAEYIFIKEFKNMSESYAYLKNYEEAPEETVAEVEIDESRYQEEGEEEPREDQAEAVELEEAWDSFIKNRYDLKGNERLTDTRYYTYSNFLQASEDDKDYFLSKYFKDIRRSPATISFAFETYKYILYNSVSRRTYRIANFDKIINGLLVAYDDLTSEESAGNIQKIYDIMSAEREGYDIDAGDYYPQLEKYFTQEAIYQLEDMRLSNGSQFSNGDIVWLYSFWARRNHEKNMDEVVAVLREIKENYN